MKTANITVATIVLALVGLIVSLYLLTVHWGWWSAVCLGVGNCEVVNTSIYSELLGIPVALLGALTYVSLIILDALIWRDIFSDTAHLLRFLIAAIGVAFSAYLTYIELFVLHEICPWCVTSAILIMAIAVLSAWEMRVSPDEADA